MDTCWLGAPVTVRASRWKVRKLGEATEHISPRTFPISFHLLIFASLLALKMSPLLFVPPPVGRWPMAWRPPTLHVAPMLAIGAGGREGREQRAASRRLAPAHVVGRKAGT